MKKIIWIILAIAVLGGLIFISYKKFFVKEEPPYIFAIATYGDIREIVSETGKVKAVEEIDLNFKNSGTVKEVKVKVGETVKTGDELLILDTADLEIKIREAESARDAASAKLRSILAGATSEDIKVYETAVKNAEENLNNLKKSTVAEIANAQKSLDTARQAVINAEIALSDAEQNLSNIKVTAENNLIDAYENAKITMDSNLVVLSTSLGDMDNILGIDNKIVNDTFEANLGVYNIQTKIDAENAYREAKNAYDSAVVAIGQINDLNQNQIDLTIPLVENALTKTSDALYKTRIMLDNSMTSSALTLTDLNTKKTTINTDRQNINTSLSSLQTNKQSIESIKLANQANINSAESQVNVAKSNLATAQKNEEAAEQNLSLVKTKVSAEIAAAEGELETARAQLALKKASPKEADVAYYRAEVERATAALDLSKKQMEDAVLKSPIDGIVTKINFEVGETVLPTQVAISLISASEFQIEADVSELDINKISLGDAAEVTFDAISSDQIFKGKIIIIEPAEKIKDSDIYYRLVVALDEKDVPIKSGMTADIDIITDVKSNVLLVPRRAVIKEGKVKKVRLLVGNQIKVVEVITGLEDIDMVEVVSGIKAGDKVITFIKE